MSFSKIIESIRALRRTELWLCLCSLLLILIGTIWVFPFWRSTAELSHGFLTPFLCLWLVYNSRKEPSAARGTAIRGVLQIILGLLGMVLLITASLSVLAEGLGHAQPVFIGIIGLAVILIAIVLALDHGERPLARLNGASLVGIGLWCCAIPLGPLESVTMIMQNHTAEWVLQTLIGLGIPALRHGNVIEFSNHLVGVEDACSGIRSLLACLYTGLFLGGLMLRGIWSRAFLVAAGGFIAVGANYVRSVVLCLLVNRNIDINGTWHDATAFAILGITVVVLFGLATLISRFTDKQSTGLTAAMPPSWSPVIPAALCSLSLLLSGLVVWRTHTPEEERGATPDLRALMALDVPGWIRRDNQDIVRFASSLGTKTLFETTYHRADVELTVYLAYWAAGQSTLGIVGLHRPDVCLPNSGWIEKPLPESIPEYPLGQVQRYAYEYEGSLHHLWFWHFYGGRIVERLPGLYPWQLGHYILKRPSSARAAQWVVRISSNRPVEELSQDPLFEEIFRRLEAAGLGEQSPRTATSTAPTK